MSAKARLAFFATLVLALVGLAAGWPAATAANAHPFENQRPGFCYPDGVQDSGSVYRICVPDTVPWNGDLLLWAHGYVAFNEPIEIPEDQLCAVEGICINDIANALGFAFATNSYSVNGLAVREGLNDLIDLVDVFTEDTGLVPNNVILVGASEGGIITTLSMERHDDIYDGGLAICGPVGSWTGQINYFGDARTTFDYFFGDLLVPGMGDPLKVPVELIENWDEYYETVVVPVVFAPENQGLLDQWAEVANLPFDPNDKDETLRRTVDDVLWYSVFATNDGHAKLLGQPFDNMNRIYDGSEDDARLNAFVERAAADQTALDEMASFYETSGIVNKPLVQLHTQWDQQVPLWHQFLYFNKVLVQGSQDSVTFIPSYRYGHCEASPVEFFIAFGTLYEQVIGEGFDPDLVRTVLIDRRDFAAYEAGLRAVEQARLSGDPLSLWTQR